MTLTSILIWIAIGLVAGWLASAVVGGGFGVVGDIVCGIVGAFIGGWVFSALRIHTPFGGIAGTIFVAFVGAMILIGLLRIIGLARRRA